jgi:hypothetical protein
VTKSVLVWSTAFIIFLSVHNAHTIHIPRGRAVDVDGKVTPAEWDDAGSTQILIERDWKVRVRFKHDDEYMYFLFEDVKHGNERLFPEIVLDPHGRKGAQWEKGEWWLHVSYNLCEGDGEPNVYRKDGVFLCGHQKDGWAANSPPDKDTQAVEVRVSFSKLGIRPTPGLHFGLAFDVTNATGNETQKWFFWPPKAKVGPPKTWGEAVLD